MQVLIVADLLQIVGEHRRKLLAIGDGVVRTFLLSLPHSLFHLLGAFRVDVELVQVCHHSVDHASPGGGIDLYVHVGRRHAGRDRAQAETCDNGRIGVAHVDLPDGSGGACLFFDAEFDVQAFALVDAKQIEPPGLIPETDSFIHLTRGLVFRDVCLDTRPVATVESIEPGLQRMSGGCVGDGGGLRPSAGRANKEDENRSQQHTPDFTTKRERRHRRNEASSTPWCMCRSRFQETVGTMLPLSRSE